MKIQDLIFLFFFMFLVYKRSGRLSLIFGLVCLVLAIPLFAFWVFFTAERLVWYGSAFIALSVAILIIRERAI